MKGFRRLRLCADMTTRCILARFLRKNTKFALLNTGVLIKKQIYVKISVIKVKFNKLPTAARCYIAFQGMGIFLSVKASKWLILFAHFCRITSKNTPIPWNIFGNSSQCRHGQKQKTDSISASSGVSFLISSFCILPLNLHLTDVWYTKRVPYGFWG